MQFVFHYVLRACFWVHSYVSEQYCLEEAKQDRGPRAWHLSPFGQIASFPHHGKTRCQQSVWPSAVDHDHPKASLISGSSGSLRRTEEPRPVEPVHIARQVLRHADHRAGELVDLIVAGRLSEFLGG